ncbi:YbaB/EbfC family DNA-binding protein [Actinoplanes sp. NEAU-A12]|uniref:YbaB/EbfC family DNA-binding protein n=1 Tax=Actinoplanes sandaracinus TaxID=3045177 RepID=A0ABT6WLG8_9ACTN|nr:YbaB/EbfC family DNA-binding protein [Actinoplanes sandaracinus]MDI6100575.1 YbaB/EbfC family DNA-binding protein [Actinoplanes sandaracinus]
MAREIDEAWIDEAIDRYRHIETLRADFDKAVAAHTVSVHSPDQSIEVVVTAAGDIVDVRLHGGLRHRQPAEFAQEMRAVVTSAAEAARWARDKLHGEVFGSFRKLEGH